MRSVDIGRFGPEKANAIIEKLNGKTYLNFRVVRYPLNGENVVNVSTDDDISKDEFVDFLLFYLAAQIS